MKTKMGKKAKEKIEEVVEKINLLDLIKTSDLANKIAKRVLETAEGLSTRIKNRNTVETPSVKAQPSTKKKKASTKVATKSKTKATVRKKK
jgi:predicted CoA-binding protein